MPHKLFAHGHFTGTPEEVQYSISLGLLERDCDVVADANAPAFTGALMYKAKATIRYQVSVEWRAFEPHSLTFVPW